MLKRAQELAQQVQTAIDNYDTAKESCESAEQFNKEAQIAKNSTDLVIKEVVGKIQNLSSELDQLQKFVNGEGDIGQRMTELNRKITEANSNIEAAMQETEMAEEQYSQTKEEFERQKSENDVESKAKDFTDSVDKLRRTQLDAKELEDGVKQLMADVKEYNDLLSKLKGDYEVVKAKVEKEQTELKALNTRATKVRQEVHEKLYVSQSCSGR